MITILGSLIGFAGSALPKAFDMFSDWQDRKHELAIAHTKARGTEYRGRHK
jgi:hypothetical protein